MLHVMATIQDINSIVLHMPLGVFKKWRSAMFVLTYNYFEE
jgi:hypothetical protein